VPNAILRGNGTARLVLTEFDEAGREVATTLTEPVAIGSAGLNYLRHRQSDVRLRDETRSVRITVRAEGSTRLQVDALTAAVR
jgi:polysaccharide pyruvyl transferase WcaK-like protein